MFRFASSSPRLCVLLTLLRSLRLRPQAPPGDFDNLGNAMVTLFQILRTPQWQHIMCTSFVFLPSAPFDPALAFLIAFCVCRFGHSGDVVERVLLLHHVRHCEFALPSMLRPDNASMPQSPLRSSLGLCSPVACACAAGDAAVLQHVHRRDPLHLHQRQGIAGAQLLLLFLRFVPFTACALPLD